MSRGQVRNCASKRRFLSKADAAAVIGGRRLGVYSCPLCSGFHLTSQSVLPATGKPSVELEKPTFDSSLLARAKWVRPK